METHTFELINKEGIRLGCMILDTPSRVHEDKVLQVSLPVKDGFLFFWFCLLDEMEAQPKGIHIRITHYDKVRYINLKDHTCTCYTQLSDYGLERSVYFGEPQRFHPMPIEECFNDTAVKNRDHIEMHFPKFLTSLFEQTKG